MRERVIYENSTKMHKLNWPPTQHGRRKQGLYGKIILI
jgi:hypothetical protein